MTPRGDASATCEVERGGDASAAEVRRSQDRRSGVPAHEFFFYEHIDRHKETPRMGPKRATPLEENVTFGLHSGGDVGCAREYGCRSDVLCEMIAPRRRPDPLRPAPIARPVAAPRRRSSIRRRPSLQRRRSIRRQPSMQRRRPIHRCVSYVAAAPPRGLRRRRCRRALRHSSEPHLLRRMQRVCRILEGT